MPYAGGELQAMPIGTLAKKLKAAERASRPRAAAAPKKGKRPCKYGPRVNGRCPPRPRAAPLERAAAAATGTRARASSRQSLGRKVAEKVVDRAATAAGKQLAAEARRYRQGTGVARRLVDRAKAYAKPAGVLAGAGAVKTAGLLSAVAAAGIISYAVTKYLVNLPKKKREDRAERAFAIAQAYRAARLEAAKVNRRPLTAKQQADLATQFKAQLSRLGFSTSDLGKL